MRRILTLIMMWTATWSVFAQQPKAVPPAPQQPVASDKVEPKAPYESTKAQLYVEKQKNLQFQAGQNTSAYQSQMKDLQAQFVDLEKKVNDWIDEVRKANGWDESYTYNRDTDTWTHTTPKPPAAEKK